MVWARPKNKVEDVLVIEAQTLVLRRRNTNFRCGQHLLGSNSGNTLGNTLGNNLGSNLGNNLGNTIWATQFGQHNLGNTIWATQFGQHNLGNTLVEFGQHISHLPFVWK
jgi:hypothetical protein